MAAQGRYSRAEPEADLEYQEPEVVPSHPPAKPTTDRVNVKRGNHDRLPEIAQWFGNDPMPRLPSQNGIGEVNWLTIAKG